MSRNVFIDIIKYGITPRKSLRHSFAIFFKCFFFHIKIELLISTI